MKSPKNTLTNGKILFNIFTSLFSVFLFLLLNKRKYFSYRLQTTVEFVFKIRKIRLSECLFGDWVVEVIKSWILLSTLGNALSVGSRLRRCLNQSGTVLTRFDASSE